MARAVTAAVVAAALVAGAAALRSASPDAPAPTPAPSGEAASLMGINEAISVPLRLMAQDRLGVAELAVFFEEDAAATASLGARWVRAQASVPPLLNLHDFDRRGEGFALADAWMRAAQQRELEVLMVLSPWPSTRTALFTDAYRLDDTGPFEAFLRAVVERYDGDGVDDMPGLVRGVWAYEVDNEPDLKNSAPPRGGERREDFCTPAEYAAMLRLSAKVIREAAPEAVILNGGFYRPMTGPGQAYMEAVFAEPGALDAIDALSIHVYSSGSAVERLERAVENGRAAAPGKPIWVTEASVPSAGEEAGLSEAGLSEAWQAEMVVQLHAAALRLGVERLMWHTLADPPPDAPKGGGGVMRHNSLLEAQAEGEPREKQAALAYRRVAALLEGVPREEVRADAQGLWIGSSYLLLSGRSAGPEGMAQVERARDGAPLELGAVHDADQDGAALFHP